LLAPRIAHKKKPIPIPIAKPIQAANQHISSAYQVFASGKKPLREPSGGNDSADYDSDF
jgi:hypothetical protein